MKRSQRPPAWKVALWLVTVAPIAIFFRIPWLIRIIAANSSNGAARQQIDQDHGRQSSTEISTPDKSGADTRRRERGCNTDRVAQLDPAWNENLLVTFTASLQKDLNNAREEATAMKTNTMMEVNTLKSRISWLEAHEAKLLGLARKGRDAILQLAAEVEAAEASRVNVQAKLVGELRLLSSELEVGLNTACSSTDASPTQDQEALVAALFHTPEQDSLAAASPARHAALVPVTKALTFQGSPATATSANA